MGSVDPACEGPGTVRCTPPLHGPAAILRAGTIDDVRTTSLRRAAGRGVVVLFLLSDGERARLWR